MLSILHARDTKMDRLKGDGSTAAPGIFLYSLMRQFENVFTAYFTVAGYFLINVLLPYLLFLNSCYTCAIFLKS